MAWEWTSNFANFQDEWEPGDTGFGDLAQYIAGTGFVSVDNQTDATPSYGRIVRIDYTPSSPINITSIKVNYNYVGGTFAADLFGVQIFTNIASTTVVASAMVDGDDQELELAVGGNVTSIIIAVRSCISIGAPAYDGTAELNFITIEGPTGSLNPFEGDRQFQSPQKYIEDQGGGASGGAGGGAGGNMAAISADGLYIYIASFNTDGNPVLIKIMAALTLDGDIVFDPGAGGRIGVQTASLVAEHLWVAGEFDGTNTVEKSEDDGATFTVKDDGTFGAIRTFELGPNDDNRIILFDGDNGDIIESIDGGSSWTTINAAVTPLVNSIARFAQNVQETVFANEGGANNSIDYSVNSGANLEDYQTGVYPNADATKVLAN